MNLKYFKAASNELRSLPSTISRWASLKLLDLGSNAFSELPREACGVRSLETLELGRNMIVRVPPEVSSMRSLRSLSLSTNHLSTLPGEFAQLAETLNDLDLSINDFTEIPECIFSLTNLNVLNMSVNSIASVPPGIGRLQVLRTLDLRCNKVAALPREIGGLEKLVFLSLQENEISELPAEIGQLCMLRELYLNSNPVQSLPETVVNMKSLRKLSLWKNELRALPEDLDKMGVLEYLDVSDNKLTALPEAFSRMPALCVAYAMNNDLSALPSFPPILQEARFTGNHITTISAPSLPPQAPQACMQILDLGQNTLGSVPGSLIMGLSATLVSLELPFNGLCTLPAELSACKELKALDVSFNEISELPLCVCELPRLETLNVSYNKLEALPPEVAHMTSLRAFSGNGNSFRKVPQPLLALTGLRSLSLADNRIVTVPATLIRLRLLAHLDLSANMLLECAAVAQLGALVDLNVGHNRIYRLPRDLSALQALQDICLDGNNIRSISPSIARLPKISHVLLAQNSMCSPITALTATTGGAFKQLYASSASLASACYMSSPSTPPLQPSLSSYEALSSLAPISQQQLSTTTAAPSSSSSLSSSTTSLPTVSVPIPAAATSTTTAAPKRRLRGYSVNSGATKMLSEKDAFDTLLKQLDTVGARVIFRVDGNPEIDRVLIAPSVQPPPVPGPIFTCDIAWSEMCGRRPDMQDALCVYRGFQGVSWQHLVGLFDGHAGSVASYYVAKNFGPALALALHKKQRPEAALAETFTAMQRDVEARSVKDGTAAVVLLMSGNDIVIANCGDSRAVLCKAGRAVDLTCDDKATSPEEVARIKKLGGFVTASGRVNGDLAVSRSIGDCALQPFVSAEPKLSAYRLSKEDEFIVLACDGVWDVLSSQQAVDVVRSVMMADDDGGRARCGDCNGDGDDDSTPRGYYDYDYEEEMEEEEKKRRNGCDGSGSVPDPQVRAATKLRDCAYSMGSGDNLSVIVIRFVPRRNCDEVH